MKFTGVIFDFNGTLLYDGEFHNQAWNILSNKLRNKSLSTEELNKYFHGVPNVDAIERLIPNTYSIEEKIALSELKESIYRDICRDQPNLSLVKGASEIFDWLTSQHIPFTIASASIRENIEFFYDTFNLTKWFEMDKIIYDNGLYHDKLEMFCDALKNIGTDKENCLIFEDSESGVKNAISAGFKNIIILHQNDYNTNFNTYPEVIFHATNFLDVIEFLKKED